MSPSCQVRNRRDAYPLIIVGSASVQPSWRAPGCILRPSRNCTTHSSSFRQLNPGRGENRWLQTFVARVHSKERRPLPALPSSLPSRMTISAMAQWQVGPFARSCRMEVTVITLDRGSWGGRGHARDRLAKPGLSGCARERACLPGPRRRGARALTRAFSISGPSHPCRRQRP